MENNINKGVELAARYALMPNRFGFCGTREFASVFQGYLAGKSGIEEVKSELEKFPVHHSYLKLIADANRREHFDYDVVEALWIGNGLLENVDAKSLRRFVSETLTRYGMDGEKGKELASKMPYGILPHHSFNVLYVNFVTDKVRASIENLDRCRIGWGYIIDIGNEKLDVIYQRLTSKNGELKLEDNMQKFLYKIGNLKTIDEPRPGDWISTHWGLAVQRLNKNQLGNLRKYTLGNVNAINSMKNR